MNQAPSIGRIVHYKLTDHDARRIQEDREDADVGPNDANHARPGDICPALVVRVFGDTPESAANLQVFLDGTDVMWATSRFQGDGPGQWSWPPRV